MTLVDDEIIKQLKYIRPGHVNLDRNCDKLAIHLTTRLPGTGELPQRWKWVSKDYFLGTYGHLGPIVWAKTSSFHMLILNGVHAFRLWTDSSITCIVDISDDLARSLDGIFEISEVPPTSLRKTFPMTKRIRLDNTKQLDLLLLQTIITYGLIDAIPNQ